MILKPNTFLSSDTAISHSTALSPDNTPRNKPTLVIPREGKIPSNILLIDIHTSLLARNGERFYRSPNGTELVRPRFSVTNK